MVVNVFSDVIVVCYVTPIMTRRYNVIRRLRPFSGRRRFCCCFCCSSLGLVVVAVCVALVVAAVVASVADFEVASLAPVPVDVAVVAVVDVVVTLLLLAVLVAVLLRFELSLLLFFFICIFGARILQIPKNIQSSNVFIVLLAEYILAQTINTHKSTALLQQSVN